MRNLNFPHIDPVALSLGSLHIRWYGLAYLTGFLGGWVYAGWLADRDKGHRPNREDIDNILPWLVLGVIAGGRLGYVLFYNFDIYLREPIRALFVWEGGMSFHGGFLGVATACIVYARKQKINPLLLGDILSAVAPIGLFFGRIANFINGELFGRVTNVPWAMIFPHGGPVPRHPSQIYEAFLEGLVLFSVMFFMAGTPSVRHKPGMLMGVFITGYGLCRFVVEYFREPDPQIGYIFQYFSLGQLLSLPMIAAGILLLQFSRKRTGAFKNAAD